jgi:transcription elongation factor GreA
VVQIVTRLVIDPRPPFTPCKHGWQGVTSGCRSVEPSIALWYYQQSMAESVKDRLIRKFEDEIQALNYELKLELPKEIRRARELGDLRENAEYAAAKERQRLVEARISLLQRRVSEIALLNVDRIPKDRAGFGSTLHVVEGNGEKLVFQLVMPEDADAGKGLISTTSPIGRAFLNKEEGDNVRVATPGGVREFEIVKLLTIHDEASG